MCRMAAYAGPAAPLRLLFDGLPHGLEAQAFAPRELLSGTVNVDGSGIVAWPADGRAPLRHASADPPWSDAGLRGIWDAMAAPLQLAAVRSGTPGQPFGPATAAPFLEDGVALAHNGFVTDFTGAGLPALLRALPERLWGRLGAATDSRVLMLHLVDALERRSGGKPNGGGLGPALGAALDRVSEIVAGAGLSARLDCIASDGRTLVAMRRAVGLESNTLYRARRPDGALLIASEALDPALEWMLLAPDELLEERL